MQFIEENLFSELRKQVIFPDHINHDLLKDTSGSKYLEKYLLLTYAGEDFKNSISPEELFYNRYYWFLTFLKAYTQENGLDAGMEQQAFKILEEAGNTCQHIDWNEVEEISKIVLSS